MIEAGLVWLGLIGFELLQSLRGRPTLSQFVWAFGRRSIWLKLLGIGLVAILALHLILPMFKEEPLPIPEAPLLILEDDDH